MENPAELSKTQDLFAAIDTLSQSDDPVKAARNVAELARAFYWKEKDLPAFVLAATSGIAYAVTKARERAEDDPISRELLGIAKGMAYDLGSFTWPGWDEPGIEIDATSLRIGREAAKANLRLAQELQRSELPLSRAYWLIGAHALAAGESEAARVAFEKAETYAQAAGDLQGAQLHSAYLRLAEAVGAPQDTSRRSAVLKAGEALRDIDGGKELQSQVLTAMRVFMQS